MTNLTFVKGDREADDLDPVSQAILEVGSGTSIFDPVICEIAYRWFCPLGGTVLDPFAGGSVRGIVASRLGRRYVGIELRPEQVAANIAQLHLADGPEPEWRQGDAREIARLAADIDADLVFSCPPYWSLERYSDDPADLSNMAREEFFAAYGAIIRGALARLRDDRFAVWIVGDVRDDGGCGVYDLSKLLRGRLGTEHAMRNPVAAGARVVVLDGAIAQIQAALAERGVTRFHKWGPSSLDPSDVAWQQGTFTARCAGLMPWSPVHVAGVRNGAGDLSITWLRRTRFGGAWADGADVPLNEESERYEVDILDGANVARTIATTLPAATYTAAQQTADFGSPQPSIAVRVYQLSATVGRGRPAAATL